jgi:hypothetical protein
MAKVELDTKAPRSSSRRRVPSASTAKTWSGSGRRCLGRPGSGDAVDPAFPPTIEQLSGRLLQILVGALAGMYAFVGLAALRPSVSIFLLISTASIAAGFRLKRSRRLLWGPCGSDGGLRRLLGLPRGFALGAPLPGERPIGRAPAKSLPLGRSAERYLAPEPRRGRAMARCVSDGIHQGR